MAATYGVIPFCKYSPLSIPKDEELVSVCLAVYSFFLWCLLRLDLGLGYIVVAADHKLRDRKKCRTNNWLLRKVPGDNGKHFCAHPFVISVYLLLLFLVDHGEKEKGGKCAIAQRDTPKIRLWTFK